MTTLSPLQELLTRVGLKSDEAQIYLELLHNGSRPAGRLATGLSLKRGYTYNLIEGLVSRGIVTEHEVRGVRYFSASGPHVLLQELAARLKTLTNLAEEFSQALPAIEALTGNSKGGVPRVQLYRGVDGIKAVYQDTIKVQNETIYAIADFETTFPEKKSAELYKWMWDYSKRRAAKEISYHGILNRSPKSDLAYKRRTQERRKLKMMSGCPLTVEINIYGSSVAITSTANDMSGIIIRDLLISSSLKMIHQALWSNLPNYRMVRKGSDFAEE